MKTTAVRHEDIAPLLRDLPTPTDEQIEIVRRLLPPRRPGRGATR